MFENKLTMSITQLLETAFHSFPDKEVIIDAEKRMTYRELDSESSNLANALRNMGIEKGDRVAVSLPNWHETLVIYFAIAKIGAILVPFNTRFRKDEIEYILSNSGAKIVFFPQQFDGVNHYQQYLEIQKSVHSLERLISVRFVDESMNSYNHLLELGKTYENELTDIDPIEDVYAILYTSGTTGRPKGAMLTHKNLVNTAVITANAMKCTPDDVFLMPTPIFHVMGLMFVLRTIASEAKMVLMDTYRPEKALQLIQMEKITIHPGVPTMFILELNHPSFTSYDLSSLRTGELGGAPCPVEVLHRIRTEMGCNVLIGYGMTETSPTLSLTSFDDDELLRAETVGKPLPGVEVKVLNEQGEEVKVGEIGELVCRTFGLMKGYYNMPEKTKEAIDENGWYYTGDLVTIDEQGYIRIVGRKKEMIIRGGYNIYPREVEEFFYTHPNVMEVAIVGLPDSVLGEITCACIRPRPGADVSIEEMKDFIASKVANYKVPDKIIFMDTFPLTPSGKIKKIELQNQLLKEITTR